MHAGILHQKNQRTRRESLLKRILFSPIFLIFWTLICAIISFSLFRNLQSMNASQQFAESMEKQNKKIEMQNQELREQIARVQSPLERERIIRDELGMQKPGETVLQIEKPPTEEIKTNTLETVIANASSSSITLTEEEQQKRMSIFRRFGNWLRQLFSNE